MVRENTIQQYYMPICRPAYPNFISLYQDFLKNYVFLLWMKIEKKIVCRTFCTFGFKTILVCFELVSKEKIRVSMRSVLSYSSANMTPSSKNLAILAFSGQNVLVDIQLHQLWRHIYTIIDVDKACKATLYWATMPVDNLSHF